MGQSRSPAVPPVDASLAARIRELEDRDGPRAALVALSARLTAYQTEGIPVPPSLAAMQDRLSAECCAMSQGR